MDPSYPKTTALDRDPAHPEQTYPGLVVDSGHLLAEGDNWAAPREELCWVCGWDNRAQMMSSYGSRLKIVHYRDNKGLWEIGGRWLRHPLIKEMRRLTDPEDKVHLVLMSRAEGVPLNKIWHTLSQEQKSSYKDQLANVLKQLRKFTSPVPCKVDGSPLDDTIVSQCGQRPTCKKFGFLQEVLRKVSPVIAAYKAGDIEHTNFYTKWRRPPFCKCRPYAGGFLWKDLGIQYEHQLPDFDWENATGTSGVERILPTG
ncbi:hypothetical protein B0J14DRAFT_625971 [Halenospora varia]|nr:hypothetical protein B0J14DRAFT_625971 [Halenospora varia]